MRILEKYESLIREISWYDFRLSGSFFHQVKAWKDHEKFTINPQRLVFHIIKHAKWTIFEDYSATNSESCLIDMLYIFLFLFQNVEDVEPSSASRCIVFEIIIEMIRTAVCMRQISANGYRTLVASLPRKWFGAIESIEYNQSLGNAYPLQLCLCFLKTLACQNTDSAAINDRQIMYLTYISDLISFQTNSEIISDPLIVQSRSFNVSSIGKIIFELLTHCENMPSSSLEYVCRKMLSSLNHCPRESKIHGRFWCGICEAIKSTKNPLIYLKQTCNSIASPEEMALLSENCIDRYLMLTRDSTSWRVVQKVLVVPELEESTFIRNCLSHCLVYTLFANSLQRLASVYGGAEHEILIAEQIGVWIESLKVESVKDGTEGKIVLLLRQFAHLLEKELKHLDIPEKNSRLRAHLPPMADALFRWSENQGSKGIWAALGFGQQSKLSPEFILFCRVSATFIVTRLLTVPESQSEKEKLIESISQLNNLTEYHAKYSDHIKTMVEFLKDSNEGLQSFLKLVTFQSRALFPDQLLILHDD